MYYQVASYDRNKIIEADSAREAVKKAGYPKSEITSIHASKTTGVGSVWLPVSTRAFKAATSYGY